MYNGPHARELNIVLLVHYGLMRRFGSTSYVMNLQPDILMREVHVHRSTTLSGSKVGGVCRTTPGTPGAFPHAAQIKYSPPEDGEDYVLLLLEWM